MKKALFDKVRQLIKTEPRRPVYVTGHSLGGALALMATAELSNDREEEMREAIAACYTFGCPKAGDSSFDPYVKAPLYRITSGVDLVPAVPPYLLGYRHVGDARYFGELGTRWLRRPPSLLRKAWFSLLSLFFLLRTGELAGIADHAMPRYIEKLDRWLKVEAEAARERRKETVDPEI